jgi:hypothetical protein
MPYEISNKLRGPSIIRLTGADTTGALPLTAFSANQAIENVNRLIITSVKFALKPDTTSGTLTILRDAVTIATLYGTGDWKHDEHGIANTSTGTLTMTIAGGGTAMLTARKEATYNVDTEKL